MLDGAHVMVQLIFENPLKAIDVADLSMIQRQWESTGQVSLRITFLILACLTLQLNVAEAQDPVIDAKGIQANRDYFTQQPFEHIDALTGSVVLSFTDLVLPGNAGRELRFTRTYNSKVN